MIKEKFDRVGNDFYGKWKKYRFSDFVTINPTVSLKGTEEYPFVEMKDLEDGNKICSPSVKRKTSSGARFQERDTLFARITPCLENGKICQVRNLENGVGFGSTEFLVFRGKENVSDNEFVFYLSRWNEVRDFAESNFEGTSGRQRVPKNCFDNLKLKFPPLPEQTAIASILSSLDDKIDLLHRQNKTLEQLAETLFRQWFVEEAEEDWEVGKIDDIAVFSNGKSRPNDVENGEIPIYGGNGILGFTNQSNYDGLSIIIGRVGAYCGSLYIENKPIWLSDNALIARGKKEDYTFYLFYLLKSLELNSMAEGSSHPLLTQTLLKSIDISVPPSQKVLNFNEQVSVFWNNIYTNQTQIRTLTHTRDTLLPKLMSGEVRVEM